MKGNEKIKILIVDDSFFIRKLLKEMLNNDTDLEVVGEACDGKEAIKKTNDLKPDVITMDYNMPDMNGAEVTKKILKNKSDLPAIIMFSAHTKENAQATLECLRAGAVDFVLKPSGEYSPNISKIEDEIIKKIKIAKKSRVKIYKNKVEKPAEGKKITKKEIKKVVLIGSSTGGPAALEDIVSSLPDNFNFTVLIVQHMPKVFTTSFSNRLNKLTNFIVKEAEEGEALKANTVYIAPGDQHMEVNKSINDDNFINIIHLTKDAPRHGLRPSIDVLMETAAQYCVNDIIGIILTGMGSDGTIGMKAIKEAGGYTIVQDPKTAVIDSMPQSVIEAGLADEVVKLKKLVKRIVKLCL